MYRKIWIFVLLSILAACQAATATPAAPTAMPIPTDTPIPTTPPTSTSAPTLTASPVPPTYTPVPTSVYPTDTPIPKFNPFPEDYTAEVYISGNYKTAIWCSGKGEPTILLENGLDYESWTTPAYSTIGRTCNYLRAGMYIQSVTDPRSTLDQVKDLHTILEKTGIPGPYILVGHSIAGYNLLVFTDQYPQEVVGLVCVECTNPAVDVVFLEKLKVEFASVPNKDAKIQEITGGELKPGAIWGQREKLDAYLSQQQVKKVTSLGARPFVVLAAPEIMEDSGWPDQNIAKLWRESWLEMTAGLSKLSSQSRMEVVPGTNHQSILKHAAVYKAVQEVYNKVKNTTK